MYPNTFVRPGLFSTIKNIGWANILDGTQKTLGVINQAIPIVYQVKPVFSNMRSMFKIASALNGTDMGNTMNNVQQNNINQLNTTKQINSNYNKPIFYL